MDIPDTPTSIHTDLYMLRTKLRDMLQSMSSFSPGIAGPPIIDSSTEVIGKTTPTMLQGDIVKGLKIFRDAVKSDLDVLERVCKASSARLDSF